MEYLCRECGAPIDETEWEANDGLCDNCDLDIDDILFL